MEAKDNIFISHSSEDKKIVTPFVEKILNLGLGIDRNKIYYTSAKDTGPRSGSDFRNTIKNKITSSVSVIQIITNNYKKSEVCLNEMGAAWVLSDNVIPFILNPIRFDNVGFIHNTTQILKLNNDGNFFKFQDEHSELYGDKRISSANYHKQVKEFLELLNGNQFRYGYNF